MSGVDALLRADLRDFAGYASAAARGFAPRIRLDANESPWANAADTDNTLRCYPEPQPQPLVDALADAYAVAPASVLACRGSDEGIDLLLRACCAPGHGTVVIAPPVFGMYAVCARLHGVDVVEVPLRDTGDEFEVDVDAMAAAALATDARLVFLCSPGNPTGGVVDPAAIVRLATQLQGRAWVVVDEAYAEFSDAPSAVGLLGKLRNLVVLRTLSKAHALAGARVGCVLATPDLILALRRCQAPYPLPVASVVAALAALGPAAFADTARRAASLVESRERLAARLREVRDVRHVYPSRGNFLLLRMDDAEAAWRRLRAAGIAVRDVRHMPFLDDALRVTVGTEAQNAALLEAMDAPDGRGGA